MKSPLLPSIQLVCLTLAVAMWSPVARGASGPVTITNQPAGITVFVGDAATFNVGVDGTPPFLYQWYRGGLLIPDATNASYTLPSTVLADNGVAFSVLVTNSLGDAASSNAVLTVDPGNVTTTSINPVPISTHLWRYLTSGADLGTAWTNATYVDSGWSEGAALFGVESAGVYAEPVRSQFSPYNAAIVTYYFRTHFNFVPGANYLGAELNITANIDDGAAIYLNGKEIGRVRLSAGQTASTLATGDNEGGTETIIVDGSALIAGDNVLAVEVHQQSTTSSDVVFGMNLNATVTNRVPDTVAPALSSRFPLANAVVRELNSIEVQFSEPVLNVDAGDLLINGSPASGLLASSETVYTFSFTPPSTGMVTVAFAPGHGIIDKSANMNPFAGASWNYTFDPNAPLALFIISEFLASNSGNQPDSLRDEDGSASDWVEINNPGLTAENIGGWYLTDDTNVLTKWRFPNGVSIGPRGYLIVFASNKNRTNPSAPLHANFALNTGGEFLALVDPNTNIISAFSPVYPAGQQTDVSYGRDPANPSVTGFFVTPTPGAENSISGPGFGPEVIFSRPGGTFVSSFPLSLSTEATNAVIRYTLVTTAQNAANATNIPTGSSTLYTGPINVTGTMQVRARAFPTTPGVFAGPPRTESYIQLNSSVVNFTSSLPVVVIHTMGGAVPGGFPTPDASIIVSFFDNECGYASLTNAPQLIKRGGVNLRGSSTQGFPKSSFAVELWDEFNNDDDASVLGLPAESDWVLYGPNLFDVSLMHNPYSLQMSRETGQYASRTRFVEVFYNTGGGAITANFGTTGAGMGNYYGIAVLEEKPKRNNDRVDIDRLRPENNTEPSLSGGYFMKVDRIDANELGVGAGGVGFSTTYGISFQDPSIPTAVQSNYIRNYLNLFFTSISGSTLTNATGTNHYSNYFDVDESIDFHLPNVILMNVDAFRLSGYFYKPRNGKLTMGPFWDNDRGMGTSKGDTRPYSPLAWRGQGGDLGTDFFGLGTAPPWYGNLFRDPDYFQKWIDRYQELRATTWTTNHLAELVDYFGNHVRSSQPRENSRWAGSGNSDTSPRSGVITAFGYSHTFPGTYQGELDFQKRWILDRISFIDTQFLARPLISAGQSAPGGPYTVTITGRVAAGNRIYYTLDGTDPRAPQNRTNTSALLYTGPFNVSTNFRVSARAIDTTTFGGNLIGANNPLIKSFWSGLSQETFVVATPPLRITEINYHPAQPPNGSPYEADDFEYIEFKNIGGAALNLRNFRLRGGVDFDFTNTVLNAGAYCVLVKNAAAFISRYGAGITIAGVFTNDNLANDGENLRLEGSVREAILDFSYSDDWHPITDGAGFSLQIVNENADPGTWGLKESWRASGVFNGTPGAADPGGATIPAIYVNEAITHTDPPQYDSIELHNPNPDAVNIGGWFLTDEFDTPKKYRIPNGTIIPGHGYFAFYENTSFGTGFGLSAVGDAVYLFSGDANTNLTGYAHGFDFGPQANGFAFGRHVISTGNDHFVSQIAPTLSNANSGPLVGPIVITEISYHPVDINTIEGVRDNDKDEYIELHNLSGSPVPLYDPAVPANRWLLRDAVDFSFPANAMIPAGGYILVTAIDPSDPPAVAAFRSRNNVPPSVPLYGPFSGQLANSGESVELARPDAPNPGSVPYILVDKANYEDTAPWPEAADGVGPTLHRISASAYGNDPANWAAAPRSPGSGYVAGTPPNITQQPADVTALAGGQAVFSVVSSGSGLTYQWRHDGGVLSGATNSMLVLSFLQSSQAGQYDCVVLNSSGASVSTKATLTVVVAATITQHPTDVDVRIRPDPLTDVAPTTNATFFVAASSQNPPLAFQWRFHGTNLPGATSPMLTVSNVTMDHFGPYSCAVSDTVGGIVSSNAWLYPLVRPLVWLGPLAQTVPAASAVPVSVVLSNGWPPPFGYQWRSNSINIATPVSSSKTNFFVIPPLYVSPTNNSATYRVVITNRAVTTFQVPNSASFTLVTVLDNDRDGIADPYEQAFGLMTNNAADALLDLDGDGMNNLGEYQAGTNPNDANSFLRVDLATMGTMANVTVAAVSNRTYTVQYSDALPASWNNLASLIARPTNRVEVLKDPEWTTNRFYRVVLPAQ